MTEVLAISIGVALAGGLTGLAFGCIIGRECSPNWDLLRELERENNHLKKQTEKLEGELELWKSGGCKALKSATCASRIESEKQLGQSREIIKKLCKDCYSIADVEDINLGLWEDDLSQAEQFLKETSRS